MPTERRAPDRRPAGRGSARRGGPGARPRQRRSVRRRGLAALVVILLAAAVWLVTFSPVFDVAAVDVAGASSETEPLVRASAQVPEGSSLLWLDTGEVAARVLTLPRVATVDVRRALPGSVVVTVAERVPVAGFPAPGGTALVDDTGLVYRTVAAPPDGVPLLSVGPSPRPSPADATTVAAVEILTSLPPTLRSRVSTVRAASPYDVAFTFTGGTEVRWGDNASNDTKAAVLTALLTRPGRVYDVSSPELAVVS